MGCTTLKRLPEVIASIPAGAKISVLRYPGNTWGAGYQPASLPRKTPAEVMAPVTP
ncbi:hypothetical protein [Geotalea toluenoxydans]|uniref:hypothetical protein n=1 Tax=Geotalea toluenoxydans TaxID=421624 RepID=UPI001FB3D93C|nr:hypothetical protein [Geotalea toluenoxydans]